MLNRKIPPDPHHWDNDCQLLLQACSEETKEMIKIFDACLALRPQRKEVIIYFMELTHPHILKLLGEYWDWQAVKLTPFETLQFIDWTYTYFKELKMYGIRDDSLYNGFVVLCNTYATKIQSQLQPLVFTTLKQESKMEVEEDYRGKVTSLFPD